MNADENTLNNQLKYINKEFIFNLDNEVFIKNSLGVIEASLNSNNDDLFNEARLTALVFLHHPLVADFYFRNFKVLDPFSLISMISAFERFKYKKAIPLLLSLIKERPYYMIRIAICAIGNLCDESHIPELQRIMASVEDMKVMDGIQGAIEKIRTEK